MLKCMYQLASARLWVGVAMLAMGLGTGACQQTAVAPVSSAVADSTAIRSVQDYEPPEKPIKPGDN